MSDTFSDLLNIPRVYKPKSSVWKYYESDVGSDGQTVVRCCYCNICFSHYTSKNATKLRQHLLLRCKLIPTHIKQSINDEISKQTHTTQTPSSMSSPVTKLAKHSPVIQMQSSLKSLQTLAHMSANTYNQLQRENTALNNRLKCVLKQNEMLVNFTQHLTKCIELWKQLDVLKSNEMPQNHNETQLIAELNIKIDLEQQLANNWESEYRSIVESNVDAKNADNANTDTDANNNSSNISSIAGHKPTSSIWKYYKFVNENSTDGYKTIKCIYCDKIFRQKVLNAYKCRTHIVDKCDKCPQHIRESEDIMVEPHAKSKVAIWKHFIVNEDSNEGKSNTQCLYCGTIYAGKNATKCREHLVAKCDKIPDDIKQNICSQCDELFLRNLQQPIKSKISIWEHYEFVDEEGKMNCKCIYCGTLYAHKNATKCREHLVERCEKIPRHIRCDISNQCEETPLRTWTQTKIPVWQHFQIIEEDGKITCECIYCGVTYATKNATKCRLHLIIKCPKIPFDVKQKICNESGDAYINVLHKSDAKKVNFMVRQRKLLGKSEFGKAGRPKCQIWQYFTDELDLDGKAVRRCCYCDTAFGYRTSRNATKLRDHIALICKNAPNHVKKNVDIDDGFIRAIKDYGHNDRRYLCAWPGCDLKFPKRSRLLKHQLVHTGNIERIKCDWPGCDWTGRDRFSVKIHKYRHTGEKPWNCDWPGCDFKTAKPSSLYIHKLRHNNIRRFKCEWPGCDRAFLTNSQRKVHKMVHLGLKPYACQLCDKCFPAPNKLKLHLNKHHNRHTFKNIVS